MIIMLVLRLDIYDKLLDHDLINSGIVIKDMFIVTSNGLIDISDKRQLKYYKVI